MHCLDFHGIPTLYVFIPTQFFLLQMAEEKTIELNGKTYPMLADGEYDCIILGTGLKECMLAGLLSKKGKKVQSVISSDALGHCSR